MLKLERRWQNEWRKPENDYVQINWERSDERFGRCGNLY